MIALCYGLCFVQLLINLGTDSLLLNNLTLEMDQGLLILLEAEIIASESEQARS